MIISGVNIEKEKQVPLVSFVVLTYNHADFVKDTIDSALSQDYPNLEIIISDDKSTDSTFSIAKQYVDSRTFQHRVILNCNSENLGLVPHLNFVINNLVHGDIIVIAGGDDISMPCRVSESVAILHSNDSIFAVTGQLIRIDKNGNTKKAQSTVIKDGLYSLNDEYINSIPFMCGGAGLAFRKEVWQTFDSLLSICPTEDSTMRFRALLLGFIYVSPNVFIKYRIHDNNISRLDNIYNLQTHGIITQYKHDLETAEKLNLIAIDVSKRLKRKILIYKLDRNISAFKLCRPLMIRGFCKLLQGILRIIIKYI